MGNFNRGDKFGGRKSFGSDRGSRGGGRDSRGGDRERPTMHHAVCSDCGRDCEVPFRPSSDKPVFCSDCFGGKDGSGERRERRNFDRNDGREKKMFSAICDKCHVKCEVPFKPTGDKPVYCSNCFGDTEKRERTSNSKESFSSENHKKQFDMLNAKLDSILKILSPKTVAEEVLELEKSASKSEDKKVEKKKVSALKKTETPAKEVKKKSVAKKLVAKPLVKKKAVKKETAKKKK